MTVAAQTQERPHTPAPLGKKASFLYDVASVAGRAVRLVTRDYESVIPALIIPIFFYSVNVGALQDFAGQLRDENGVPLDYKAFQLPVAIIFAVTGISRALTVVTDIQSGYFDRLSLTPVNRLALLLGMMISDFLLVVALTIPVLIMGLITGIRFESGPIGMVAFVLIAALWGLIFAGFPYAVALKTGNPAAVNTSWLVFFPFVFLTTVFIPREAMTGWMATVTLYNPVTYLLDALRSLIMVGWDAEALGKGLAAVGGVAAVSLTLAFTALRGRVRRK